MTQPKLFDVKQDPVGVAAEAYLKAKQKAKDEKKRLRFEVEVALVNLYEAMEAADRAAVTVNGIKLIPHLETKRKIGTTKAK
jgi:hypothetical protein